MSKFTVCVLLFGDHPDLAERCLSSLTPLLRSGRVARLNLIENRLSLRSQQVVDRHKGAWRKELSVPLCVYVPHAAEDVRKYPLLRRVLRDTPQTSLDESTYLMWFDDDSYLADAWLTGSEACLRTIDEIFSDPTAGIAGEIWYMRYIGRQQDWIRTREWFKGVRFENRIRFVTGGWWVARLSVLLALDWPDEQLNHNGGDTMLGVAMRQNGYKCVALRHVAVVNDAARRGYSEPPVGAGYPEVRTPNHNFILACDWDVP